MTDCLRCGKCCHYVSRHYASGLVTVKPCRYLCKISGGLTFCAVYDTRLGRLVAIVNGIELRCILREKSLIDYPGCPYNKKDPLPPGDPPSPS